MTVIVYEENMRVDDRQVLKATILMSVYRRNGKAEAIIYEKLREILDKVKERYKDA